jgi:Caspase domain
MRKVAMLVANDTFPLDETIKPLRFTQNDASELKEILDDPETCGFETKLYLNEPSQKVLADLEEISGELEPDDTLLFYYAGHGKLRRDGQLCLASKDTTMANLGATSIRTRDVLAYLQESRARRRVLILDCSHSGAIGRSGAANSASREISILTSSTAIQLAEEREEDGHGIFTKALIDCLREGRKDRITLNDLYEYAYARLKISARHTPLFWAFQVEGEPIEIANYVGRPVTRLEPKAPLGLIGNGGKGEGASGSGEFQKPKATLGSSHPDIFISYARGDRPRAKLLADTLKHQGWSVCKRGLKTALHCLS